MAHNHFIYVEDDAALAGVTCSALERRGFTVEHFVSLKSVECCDHLQLFTHALLDLKLEDGYSLPLIERLTEANPDIKTVVLTGYASLATAVQAVKMGAVNYLAKPATVDEVLVAFDDKLSAGVDEHAEAMSLRRREWETIQAALAANEGNISATARQLKMHRRTLQRKLQKRPVAD